MPPAGWRVRLEPESLSPDPTRGRPAPAGEGFAHRMDVFPWRLVRCVPTAPAADAWAERCDGAERPGPLTLGPAADGTLDVTVDFGTELEAELVVAVETGARATVMVVRGEFLREVEEHFPSAHPAAQSFWHLPGPGVHGHRGDARGFRFVRLRFLDLEGPITLRTLHADAEFMFREAAGDFRCSDRRFQRAWQSSLYTARLCTRPDAFWDGIKRDRIGWFGDARITKMAIDATYHDPRPSRAMLADMPTQGWVNGVPVFSFDAVLMLRDHALAYGLDDPAVAAAYPRMKALLGWVAATQLDGDGFVTRDPTLDYFKGIGFLDWSAMPVGGRFEELSWLQCKHVEALRAAAELARWYGRHADADGWTARARGTAERIRERFWRPGRGYVHTLHHVGPVENPHAPGWGGHFEKTYEQKIRLGESGPSRQCNALAVLAGVATEVERRVLLDRVFAEAGPEPVITAYFLYFEQMARAACGDPAGAVETMAGYVADLLEDRDAATVVEMHDPRVRDFRRFCNHFDPSHDWPLSYCHGWGSGLIPLAQRHLLGLRPTAPGWARLALDAPGRPPMDCEAEVATPFGPVSVRSDRATGRTRYRVPSGIDLDGPTPDAASVERS